MLMYPGYRRRDVLEEYTISFYGFLAEGYRLKYEEYIMQINIQMLPNAVPESRAQFIKQLQYASMTPGDILKPSDDSNGSDGIAELKNMFRKT